MQDLNVVGVLMHTIVDQYGRVDELTDSRSLLNRTSDVRKLFQ